MKRFSILLLFVVVMGLNAQENSELVDSRYLEDQFYAGITYNFIFNLPSNVTQRNLSYGLQGGFIKDIPINKDRTVGFGIGLGYAINSYYTNLLASESANGIDYSVLSDNIDYKRSKIETQLIEMPIEFRWRNSTATEYKFWRVYAGVKLGYVVNSRSKFVTDSEKRSFYNGDVKDFQYGLMLNFGYNTFNVHVYYALDNLFEDGVSSVDNEPIEYRPLQIGLIFYIL